MNFNEREELSAKAAEALQRLRDKKTEKSSQQILNENQTKFDYSRAIFEEYSDSGFITKTKLDAYIYESLLSNCLEEHLGQVQDHLSSYISIIKNIYEHINIEPKLSGFTKLTLESSENDLIQESRRIIYEYIDKNYYSLSPSQRSTKYKDYVINEAQSLVINDKIDIQESVDYIYKSTILSNLLEGVAFPFTIKCKIEELLESDIYKTVFDVDKLQTLWEQYNDELTDISRIFALVI